MGTIVFGETRKIIAVYIMAFLKFPRLILVISVLSGFTGIHFTSAAHARKRPVQAVPRRSTTYDKQITTFDPQGQLLQLEYAQRAASKGSTGLFFHLGDCIIAVLESASFEERNQSMYRIHDGMLVKMTGLQGDSRVLAKYLLQNSLQMEWMEGQIHENLSGVRVKQIADVCAEVQHSLTTRPGARPLAVNAVLFGIDGIQKDYENDYCKIQLGLYKCHLSGVVDACKFCMVGNIMLDRVMSRDALRQLDTLWRELNEHQPQDDFVEDNIGSSSTSKTRIHHVIHTMSSIVLKHLHQGKVQESESTPGKLAVAVDIYMITPSPKSRGGVKISCATCVQQDDIEDVCTALEKSMNE